MNRASLTGVGPQRAASDGAESDDSRGRRRHATLNVLVAHSCPLVAAGMVAALQRLPECDIRIRDAETGARGDVPHSTGVHVVIGDSKASAAWMFSRGDSITLDRGVPPRFVLVETAVGDDAAPSPEAEGIAWRLPVDCGVEELLDAVRRLGSGHIQVDWSGKQAARGGLAPGALRRVRQYIEAHIDRRIELADLAKVAGLSDCHFSRAFKQSVGLPPHQYLLLRRIEVAAEIIDATDRPLAEICLEVGFSDQSHFTRAFVRLTGETPRSYRRRRR